MSDSDTPGVIEPGKLYVAEEARQRLRIGATAWRKLRKSGLQIIRRGRQAYVFSDDLLAIFAAAKGGSDKRPLDKTPPARGSIRADEVLLYSEAARRLGLCVKSRRFAKQRGLHVVKFGRFEYVIGIDVLDFFRKLAEQSTAATEGSGHE